MTGRSLSLTGLDIRRGSRLVLDGVDLGLGPGFTALVGPNGSGKSTLLSAIARLLAPERGIVAVDGDDVARLGARDLARRVALLPQQAEPPDGVTVRSLVLYGRYPHLGPLRPPGADDHRAVADALELCGVAGLADREMTALSGGQAQRVRLACTLAQGTPWVLADEPTTYLDLRHQVEVLRLLRSLASGGDRRVVAVLHDLNHALHYADRVVVLAGGTIVADGAPARVVDAALLRDVWGVEASVVAHPDGVHALVVPAV